MTGEADFAAGRLVFEDFVVRMVESWRLDQALSSYFG